MKGYVSDLRSPVQKHTDIFYFHCHLHFSTVLERVQFFHLPNQKHGSHIGVGCSHCLWCGSID